MNCRKTAPDRIRTPTTPTWVETGALRGPRHWASRLAGCPWVFATGNRRLTKRTQPELPDHPDRDTLGGSDSQAAHLWSPIGPPALLEPGSSSQIVNDHIGLCFSPAASPAALSGG